MLCNLVVVRNVFELLACFLILVFLIDFIPTANIFYVGCFACLLVTKRLNFNVSSAAGTSFRYSQYFLPVQPVASSFMAPCTTQLYIEISVFNRFACSWLFLYSSITYVRVRNRHNYYRIPKVAPPERTPVPSPFLSPQKVANRK